jgi:hypothetical protein
VDNSGTLMSGDVLRNAFMKHFQSAFGERLLFNQYRHIAISFARWKLNHIWDVANDRQEDDVHDLQAGHSSTVANTVYGRSNLVLRVLGPDALYEFHRISCKWHDLLGELHHEIRLL